MDLRALRLEKPVKIDDGQGPQVLASVRSAAAAAGAAGSPSPPAARRARGPAGRRRWGVCRAFRTLGLSWRLEGKPGVLRYGLFRSTRAGSLRREPWDRSVEAERLFLEARRAYRRAAWDAHPDRGGSLERMQEVTAAWAWLRRRLTRVAARQHQRPLAGSEPLARGLSPARFGSPPDCSGPAPSLALSA